MTGKRKQPDVARHEEALQSVIKKSGGGEDAVIRDLVSGEMATKTDTEALNMALALQQIARQQDSILELVKQNTKEGAEMREQLSALKREAAERDAANEKWQTDQQKFIQNVLDQAEKLRVAGTDLDKIKAEAAQTTAKAMTDARVKMRDDARKFDEELARMKKVTVMAPGEVVMTMSNGVPSMKVLPTIIRIKHRQWVLPAGRRVEVPQAVADLLYKRMEGMEQQGELKDALSANMEAPKLRDKMRELRKRDEAPYDPAMSPSPAFEEPSELDKLQ